MSRLGNLKLYCHFLEAVEITAPMLQLFVIKFLAFIIQEFNGEEFELKKLNNFLGQLKNFKPISQPSPCLDIDFPFYHLSIE